MSTVYDDSRYGIEKVITFPIVNFAANAANTIFATLTTTEDILPIEFGSWVTTAISGGGGSVAFALQKTGAALVALGSITIATGTAVGANSTATLTSTTALSSGDILIVKLTTSNTAGAVQPYLKYRAKFV